MSLELAVVMKKNERKNDNWLLAYLIISMKFNVLELDR